MIFLAGARAYKLKRAVWFPFLDFTSADKRRDSCEAEVRLNRRTAPDLYLGVVPITHDADGQLALDGAGTPVDWLVVMRRFDQNLLFDKMARRNALDTAHLLQLADHILDFHRNAEIRKDQGGVEAMRWIVEDNMDELATMAGIFAPENVAELRTLSEAALSGCADILETRRAEGFVRRCHGDLHLRNICLLENRAPLFDCIEFSDAIACTDTFYDLAFLLMDLEHRGHRDFANQVFNRYTARTGDTYGFATLPLFLSCRAAVRAKIEAATSRDTATSPKHEAARSYCARAIAYRKPEPPRLIAVGGGPGSGKSTLTQALAPMTDPAPGALVLRSDVLRKRQFGYDMFDSLPQACYSGQATTQTCASLVGDAAAALQAGMSVIADAVFGSLEQRAAIEESARAAKVPFTGIWLNAPLEVRAHRISRRGLDASDATAELVRQHAKISVGDMRWNQINADQPIDKLLTRSRSLLYPA